jgi:hypothetical protein
MRNYLKILSCSNESYADISAFTEMSADPLAVEVRR